MPIRAKYEHFEFPKDFNLEVSKEKPKGEDYSLSSFKSVLDRSVPGWQFYYFCRYCDGWIKGEPRLHYVNTMGHAPLAGRKGMEYYCLRCAKMITFSGMMS